jgi:predicted permease
VSNWYRLLLHLYPSSYRAEYGDEMSAIFEEELRNTSGTFGRLLLLLRMLGEVLTNASALHRETAMRDLRYASRCLLRSPGFTITALLLIIIGVGANTSVFTLTDFVFVRPLPFPQADRLVRVWEKHPGYSEMELSPANYRDWKGQSKSFESLAAYYEISMNLVGEGDPQRLDGGIVTADLFPLLERPAWLGRYFNPEDDRAGAAGTVVLSYGVWQARFGGDASILGKSIFLDNKAYAIIGVTPPDFHFPTRDELFWITTRFQESDFVDRDDNYLEVVGRLKPNVTLAQSRSELELIAARLRQQYPKENEGVGATVAALRDELSAQSRLLLTALCGAAVCVLVIICANLANLLLVRSLARRKEFSIRMSLGANYRHVLRQLVTESLLLGLMGGLGAIAVAAGALPLLSRLVPTSLPIQQVPSLDARMLILALGLTLITVLSFGLAPAIRVCRSADFAGLHEGVRTGGVGSQRARSALVIAEVIVSLVLLISSSLLVRALWRVQSTDPGFRTDGVLTLRTPLPFPKYEKTTTRNEFYQHVLANIRRLPGVDDAAYISGLPMTWGGGIWPVRVKGQSPIRTQANSASLRFVTPGFFATLGIPVKAGRDASENDTSDRPYVAIVSESFAQRYWPKEQPIGQHFEFGMHDREVVGVVGNVLVRGLERTSEPQVYIPYQQVPDGNLTYYAPKDLAVRASRPAYELLPAIRSIVLNADPEQPISNVRTMDEIMAGQTASRAIQVRVLVAFTAIAILLAGIGIYGLLSFAVSLRQQELGIRIALGARRRDVFSMILRRGMALALAGIFPGLALAYVSARLMQGLLAGVKPDDALTFSLAAAICLGTTLLGSIVPALRAFRVDPTTVMRAE